MPEPGQDGDGSGPAAVAGTLQVDGGPDIPVQLDQETVAQARDAGVDVQDVMEGVAADVDVFAQSDGGDGSTIPVQDHRNTDLTNRRKYDRDFTFIQDDQIQRLLKNSVNYTEDVGDFLLSRGDLIPTVKERLKALIVGEDGIQPEAADPDSDADQRLEDHLNDVYQDDVQPTEVIDAILRENFKNARAVLRAVDLAELDLATLTYLRDGITGEEIYVQDQTTVYTFEDPGDSERDGGDIIPGIDLDQTTRDAQALVIGDHVYDVSLYDKPPLEAVADTAVNKMVLQRLKARKAEITSFGAVYATVEPPSYLPEDQYFDRVQDADYNDDDDQPPTKLERALKQNIQKAYDTLKDYQSGTVMAVPDNWTLEQLDIPETDDPIDDQIRGYNRDIARRLLVPLDLIELESGSELSRETLFQTLMTTIAGWRREIKRVFDQFADTQAEIHGISGEVEHTFPPLKDANTKQIVAALQHAGIGGLSQQEVRQMLNAIQGVDLETDPDDMPDDQQMPPEGGPASPQDRQQAMQDFLDDQQRGPGQDDTQPPAGGGQGGDGDSPQDSAQGDASGDFQATMFQVVAPEDDQERYADRVLGIGVDFPNSGVYVDWRNSVFPDELEHPHVSEYGSINDLEDATGNTAEPLENINIAAASAFVAQARDIQDDRSADRQQDGSDAGCASMDIGDVAADGVVEARTFNGFDSLREAAHHVRTIVERDVEQGKTVEVRLRESNEFVVIVRGQDGAFESSLVVSDADGDDDWEVVGTTDVLELVAGRHVDAWIAAAAAYQEGQKVRVDGQRAVVVEVRTSPFEGPDGGEYSDGEIGPDNPVYIVADEDGATAVREDDIDSDDWSVDVEDPTGGLQETAEAMHATVMAALPADADPVVDGTLAAGPTDWDYPESWQESETPSRLILLDAWSSMGGQFDCGGGCCMGTMTSSGMSQGHAAEFCASMKDRVLMWEGWRQGG